jgi:hypothetical protein
MDRSGLYSISWNVGVTVPYRNAIGWAIGTDGCVFLEPAFGGPVVDRDRDELFFTAAPFVLGEPDDWLKWYASALEFLRVGTRVEPVHVIAYVESEDGVRWRRENVTCVAQRLPDEANARPWMLRDRDTYRLPFSYRARTGPREDHSQRYRLGYAEFSTASCRSGATMRRVLSGPTRAGTPRWSKTPPCMSTEIRGTCSATETASA